jgi:hypothetical protein
MRPFFLSLKKPERGVVNAVARRAADDVQILSFQGVVQWLRRLSTGT